MSGPDSPSVRMRIGIVPGVTARKWFKAWDERHPRNWAHQVPLEQHAQMAAIRSGEVAIAFVRDPEIAADLHVVRLYDEVPVAVAARDHLIAAAEEVTLADFEDDLLDLPADMSLEDQVAVTLSAGGVVVVPHAVARTYAGKEHLFRPVTDLPRTSVALSWLKDNDGPQMQDFVGIVKGRTSRSSR